MQKPFSQACENNKAAILTVLKQYLFDKKMVLEVGSGTGQHAVYFSEHLPHLIWQTSDQYENHNSITSWLHDYNGENCRPPLILNVNQHWPTQTFDAIFSANTLHIMSLSSVENFFKGAAVTLDNNGLLLVYGPFNYNREFTSDSNANFNRWLQQQNPDSAIRDFEKVDALAQKQGLQLQEDITMPANNRLLIWKKS